MSRAIRTAVATVGMVLVGPTLATAATPLGETFTPPMGCDDVTLLQAAPASYAAPSHGVITSWSFQAGTISPQLKFKVGRPAGADTFTIVGESSTKTPVANQPNTYSDVRISVQPGDVIGVGILAMGRCIREQPTGGYVMAQLGNDDHQPGEPPVAYQMFANYQIDVAAILEPDCDNDGFGDETQDPELPLSEACGKGTRTLILDANKNKVKKGKKVRLSGRLSAAARQGPCESGQTVELQRKRPKQMTFTTFAQVQTDAQGSFSLKKKVKKTFEYRAQVVETATCTSALSNSEKVKVKKKQRK